jgi:uncharacterized spore protein YtfJ
MTPASWGWGPKLCTDAVICIHNQDVTLLPVNSNASSIADKIPQIVSGMSQNKQPRRVLKHRERAEKAHMQTNFLR